MQNDLRRFWQILMPTERRKALWILLLMMLVAGAETLGVVSIVPFLSVLSRPSIVHENVWLSHAYTYFHFRDLSSFIIAAGAASTLVVLISSAFKIIAQHLIARFIHLQRHELSTRLLSRYLQQPYEFFLAKNTADLGKNILSETDHLMFNLAQPFAQVIAQGAVVIAISTLIVCYDPWMAAWIIGTISALYGTVYASVRSRLKRIGNERGTANGERYRACNEALGGIKDVKVTHSAPVYLEYFRRASRLYSRHLATNETFSQAPLYLVEAVGYTGLIVISLVLIQRSDDPTKVLPALGLYGFAAYRLLPAAQVMYRGFARLKFSSAALSNLCEGLSLPGEPSYPTVDTITPRRSIELKGVRFAYPSTPHDPVLNDFNLSIQANTSTGLVGRSGAGKSTIMDLLLGLLEPQSGALVVDGTPVNIEDVAAWQRSIGYVPQHIYLADTSVAENIAFGVPRDAIDMESVERAARTAQIHDFVIRSLPSGYETTVGDRGVRLSGGQRQRIGIARALYRDPPILLMDEATSALDPHTEELLNVAIHRLSGAKTIIMIAHKTDSLRYCEHIYSITEATTGTH